MKVVIIPGHTLIGKGTGAVGYINESKETRILNDLIVKWLKIGGATVYTGRVDESSNHLADQCAIANKQETDLAVQIHFNSNATTSTPVGTETIYKTNNGKTYAEGLGKKVYVVGGEANKLVKGDVVINGADRYETVKLALQEIDKL
ncbi:N-acetylmuramoyl-L-alanine amidase [Clostridioides difficile]|nr:N-acetylmuramoyl-L-alanine amidase [Clostridioides difficile]